MRRDLVPAMNRPEPRELVVESRTLERLFTHAVGFGLLLPPVGRALLPSLQRLARGDVVLRALACSWLPTTWPHAAPSVARRPGSRLCEGAALGGDRGS